MAMAEHDFDISVTRIRVSISEGFCDYCFTGAEELMRHNHGVDYVALFRAIKAKETTNTKTGLTSGGEVSWVRSICEDCIVENGFAKPYELTGKVIESRTQAITAV